MVSDIGIRNPLMSKSLVVLCALLGFFAMVGCRTSTPEGEVSGNQGPPWRPGYIRPPVIDIHGHIYPDALSRLRKTMDNNGVVLMVNLSGGNLRAAPQWPLLMGDHAERTGQTPPPMVHFFNLDWRGRDLPGFGDAMARALEVAVVQHGYGGLKIPKVLGLYAKDGEGRRLPVDWPELDPVWAKAGELGVPVAIHTADPKAFWLPPTPDNERYEELSVHPDWSFHGPQWPPRLDLLAELERVFAKHPKTTFIAVHFGNNAEEPDYVERILDTYPNVYVDTAARLGEIGRHPPERMRALFVKHADRIVFGTDIGLSSEGIMLGSTGTDEPGEGDIKPFYDAHWRFFEGNERAIAHPTPIQGRWTIDAIGLPEEVLEKIYWRNAARILKIPEDQVRTHR